MGKLINSNSRRAVTDRPFSAKICQGCTFDPKKEIPYWVRLQRGLSMSGLIRPKNKNIYDNNLKIIKIQSFRYKLCSV